MLSTLKQLTRWDEWYESKVPLFFIAGYTWVLYSELSPGENVARFLLWLAFTVLYLAFGYAINDFSDLEVDRLAKKSNALSELSNSRAIIFLLAIGAAGLLILAPFYGESGVAALVLANYLLAISYSLPPVRFKERGSAGLLVAAAAQRATPLLIGMALYRNFNLSSWLLFILFTLMGIRWILVHQILDLANDEKADVRTFTRTYGHRRSLLLMKTIVFPLEVICLSLWLLVTLWPRTGFFLVIGMVASPLLVTLFLRKDGEPIFHWVRYGRLPLTNFYMVWWPFSMGIIAVSRDLLYLGLLIIQFCWQAPYLKTQVIKVRQRFLGTRVSGQ